jgi:hypothetical protein
LLPVNAVTAFSLNPAPAPETKSEPGRDFVIVGSFGASTLRLQSVRWNQRPAPFWPRDPITVPKAVD